MANGYCSFLVVCKSCVMKISMNLNINKNINLDIYLYGLNESNKKQGYPLAN